jgi:predicted transcriptional regulator
MKILKEGDRGVALAPERGRVEVVYRYRDLPLEESGIVAKGVLVGIDPETDEILTVPAQSAPKLKASRDATKEVILSVRLPHELSDVLNLVADRYHRPPDKFAPALLRYYLASAGESPGLVRRMERLSKTPLAKGRLAENMRIRVRRDLRARVEELAAGTEGVNQSDLVRGAILAAKEDILDGRAKRRSRELGAIAQAL